MCWPTSSSAAEQALGNSVLRSIHFRQTAMERAWSMTSTVRRFAPQPILIPAGTIITCENGRRVCTTAVDLHVNALLTVEMLTASDCRAGRAHRAATLRHLVDGALRSQARPQRVGDPARWRGAQREKRLKIDKRKSPRPPGRMQTWRSIVTVYCLNKNASLQNASICRPAVIRGEECPRISGQLSWWGRVWLR